MIVLNAGTNLWIPLGRKRRKDDKFCIKMQMENNGVSTSVVLLELVDK